jgi:hypothetical protein
MTTYYRVSDAALRELTAEQFAALAPNKQADLRVYIVDARPIPSATEVVVDVGVVVGLVEAHYTYGLRAKTADELEGDALSAEKIDQIDGYLLDLNTQLNISNADRALLTNVQRINELEKDTRVLMRAVKFLLRQAKRQ